MYVPVRPTPSLEIKIVLLHEKERNSYLQWTIIGDDRPRKHLFTFLQMEKSDEEVELEQAIEYLYQ